MTEVELFQVLATKAILPYEAWKRLNAHYKLIGLPLTWSKNTRFWSEYIAVKTMENVSIPEYTNEQTVDAGSNQEMDLNLVNCCIDNRQKLRTIHFQEQLLVFATQSMLVIRRLLSDALLNQGASVASWPEFVRFLLCRLCVQYFSTPWDQHESSSFEEVSNIIALHQIVLHIFYNYNAICNWKHGQFIPWLWYHVEHLNMESALIRLMQHKRKWYPKPSCRDRTPLELCGSTRVLIRSESTRPSVISELAASTSSFIVSSTSQLQSSGSERKSDIHPYQLGLALSAVLSQAVHLIYVAQHEMQQYGIYHERCLHNHSLWDVKRATVHEVSRVLYNRVVMMLNSSTVMANCTGTLNDSADETILSCCQSSCHWCILLRAVCTAVLRLINVRGGTNDSSSSNLLGSLSSDSSVSTNDNIHIPICVKTHSHCIQCILNENAESGNSSFAERNYNTLGLGRKNKNFSHYPVVRQQWHSIPLELMLKQALWCFKDACLLLQQYHSLNTSVISKLNESMKWRTAARLERLVPFAIGGALESVALYHLLEKYWQDGAVRVLPRVICLMQRIILEEVSICYERDYFCAHKVCHFDVFDTVANISDALLVCVNECLALTLRYYDFHRNTGWSETPLRVATVNSDIPCGVQQHQLMFAACEALLSYTLNPNSPECLPSRVAFLGPIARYLAQCSTIDGLRDSLKISQYAQKSLLRWSVVCYSDNPQDVNYPSLADLEHTCRIANSVAAKRSRTANDITVIGENEYESSVDRVELNRAIRDGTYNKFASMTVVDSLKLDDLWRHNVTELNQTNYRKIRAEILACHPTSPRECLKYAIICSTPEASDILRELNDRREMHVRNPMDLRRSPGASIQMPGYLHFLHNLIYGNDTQLAQAVCWLYNGLFSSSRLANSKNVTTENTVIYLQKGDSALRIVRLLPMLLQSLALDNLVRVQKIHHGLAMPYRNDLSLRSSHFTQMRKKKVSTQHQPLQCNEILRREDDMFGTVEIDRSVNDMTAILENQMYRTESVLNQVFQNQEKLTMLEPLIQHLQFQTGDRETTTQLDRTSSTPLVPNVSSGSLNDELVDIDFDDEVVATNALAELDNSREQRMHQVSAESIQLSDDDDDEMDDLSVTRDLESECATIYSNSTQSNEEESLMHDCDSIKESGNTYKKYNGYDARVYNLPLCPLYSNILAMLAPYKIRVRVAHRTLQRIWSELLYNRELWLQHHLLAGVMIELMQPPRIREYASKNSHFIPTWHVWRLMRTAYIRWRKEQQKYKCPASRGRFVHRAQSLSGVPNEIRQTRTFEMSDQIDSTGALRQKLVYRKAISNWCLCQSCSRVSCAREIPQWITDRIDCEIPVQGFWKMDNIFQDEHRLMDYIHGKVYVPLDQYLDGPAVKTGVYPSQTCGTDGVFWSVYDPLCPVPPFPDNEEARSLWREYSPIPSGHLRNRNGRFSFGDPEYLHMPSCSTLYPDLDPPHLLLYLFACDPRISDEFRAEIFMAVQAVEGLIKQNIRPSPPANDGELESIALFQESVDQANRWIVDEAQSWNESSAKIDLTDVQFSTPKMKEILRWMGGGLQPLSLSQSFRENIIPLNGIVALVFMTESLLQLPYHWNETEDVVKNLLHCRYAEHKEGTFDATLSRATMTVEALMSMYDPTAIHQALMNLYHHGRTFPKFLIPSVFSSRDAPLPHNEVLHEMRDWSNPKACYSHELMLVYDNPLVEQNSSDLSFVKKEVGPFSLSVMDICRFVVNNPISNVSGDIHAMNRLESALLRTSIPVQNSLQLSSQTTDSPFYNDEVSESLLGSQTSTTTTPLLFHGVASVYNSRTTGSTICPESRQDILVDAVPYAVGTLGKRSVVFLSSTSGVVSDSGGREKLLRTI
jgi:hypothetical protein